MATSREEHHLPVIPSLPLLLIDSLASSLSLSDSSFSASSSSSFSRSILPRTSQSEIYYSVWVLESLFYVELKKMNNFLKNIKIPFPAP